MTTEEFIREMSTPGAKVFTPVPYSQNRSSLNRIGEIADRVILLDDTDAVQKTILEIDLIMLPVRPLCEL